MINFNDLNEYVVLNIFDYCSDNDLENLYLVCRRFRDIIEHCIYYRRSLGVVMSGCCKRNNERTFNTLSYRDRLRISRNWCDGRYKEYFFFHHPKWYRCRIALEKNTIFLSYRGQIRSHKRSKVEMIERRNWKEISEPNKEDISDFVKKGDSIFAGRTNGSCFVYEDDVITEQKLHGLKEYLTCVDFQDQIFVTSSDKTTKLWSKSSELGLIEFELSKDYHEPYKCLRISPDCEKIACGKYIDRTRRALCEIDIETGIKQVYNSDTSSIYNLMYKTDDVILTAHYDTSLRLFDKRTDKDELIWMDPFDASVYCLEYDGLYGVVCGMQYHCRVNLYDLRIPRKHCQMFFPVPRKSRGSPVYSIACDCQYLYIATDSDLRVFDYKVDWAESKDYRNFFVRV